MFVPTVYKPAVTRPLPTGVELFEDQGRLSARWRDSRGRLRTAPIVVAEKGPYAGQQRIVIESDRYVARYRDAAGVIRTVATGCRDEAEARGVLDRLMHEAGVEQQIPAKGSSIPSTQAAKSFGAHFRDYIRTLKARRIPARRLADAERQVRRVARQCGFAMLTDIQADAVRQWLKDRQAEGMPAAARNAHLDDLAEFVQWCLVDRRLSHDPLRGLTWVQEPPGAARQVRPLTEEELLRLVRLGMWRPLAEYGRQVQGPADRAGSQPGPRFTPLTVESLDSLVARGREQLKGDRREIARLARQGWQRALIYKTLALTGLRRSELTALRVGSLRLIRAKAYLLPGIPGGQAGRDARIPLRADLAEDLRLWLRYRWRSACKGAGNQDRSRLKKVFVRKPLFKLPSGLAKLLAVDLQAAGICETDARGCRVDIHAAREAREEVFARKGQPLNAIRYAARESDAASGPGVVDALKEGLQKAFRPRRKDGR